MRNPVLELLRALAAALVMITHFRALPGMAVALGPFEFVLNWGMEAVVLFFLISGLVIRLNLDRLAPSRSSFYLARARRILPLYYVALLLSGLIWHSQGGLHVWQQVAWHAVFLQSKDSLTLPLLPSNLPLWSIPYELAYYLLIGLCLSQHRGWRWTWCALAALAVLMHTILGLERGSHLLSMLAFSAIWLLGFHLPTLQSRWQPSWLLVVSAVCVSPAITRLDLGSNFESPLKYCLCAAAWCPLLLRSLQYTAEHPSISTPKWERNAVIALLVLALFGLWQFSSSKPSVRIALGALVVLGPCMSLLGPWLFRLCWRRALLLQALGRGSYALYLIHFPIFMLAVPLGLSGWPSAIVLSIAAVLAAALMEWSLQPILVRWLPQPTLRPTH